MTLVSIVLFGVPPGKYFLGVMTQNRFMPWGVDATPIAMKVRSQRTTPARPIPPKPRRLK
jgi:hypothetical protein